MTLKTFAKSTFFSNALKRKPKMLKRVSTAVLVPFVLVPFASCPLYVYSYVRFVKSIPVIVDIVVT